jgi:hypothetical protein
MAMKGKLRNQEPIEAGKNSAAEWLLVLRVTRFGINALKNPTLNKNVKI